MIAKRIIAVLTFDNRILTRTKNFVQDYRYTSNFINNSLYDAIVLIDGKQVTGCTNEIMIPSLNVREPIKQGKNIIEFTPNKTGTVGFSCWMGMVRGKFIVE